MLIDINGVRDCFSLKGFCFEIDPQHFIKEAFHCSFSFLCLRIYNQIITNIVVLIQTPS